MNTSQNHFGFDCKTCNSDQGHKKLAKIHQKSAAAIAPMLSVGWGGFAPGYQCSASCNSSCIC